MPLTWTAPPADPQAWPLPPAAITHPRTAGTFSRALRLLARGSRTLQERRAARRRAAQPGQALAKCSLEPARLLGPVPAMRRKGRLQGLDADMVVFDPATIAPGQLPAQHAAVAGYRMSWSTAPLWCATATSRATPGRCARSAPTRAEPGRAACPG